MTACRVGAELCDGSHKLLVIHASPATFHILK